MRKEFIISSIVLASAVAGAAHANLITNGDFESGNTAFSSDYTFGSVTGATTYNVVTNPANHHGQATSFGDHTTGFGSMMMVNGCCEPAQSPIPDVWIQSVSVNPFTDYLFSLFVSSWFPANPALLALHAPELGILGTVSAPSTAGVWQGFQVGFNSGANSALTLTITDIFVLTGGAGNDFALDDLRLVAVSDPVSVPEPATLSLLGAGLLGMGLLKRRRRSRVPCP